MKAITIYQPWASLIAAGAKTFETRSWATNYRGTIAIHAGKKLGNPMELHLFWEMVGESLFAGWDNFQQVFDGVKELPYGAVIATAELVDCWCIVAHPGADADNAKSIAIGAELNVTKNHPRFRDYIVPTETELLFGGWTPGRYAWELRNIKPLQEPIPFRGFQRIWNVPSEIETSIKQKERNND